MEHSNTRATTTITNRENICNSNGKIRRGNMVYAMLSSLLVLLFTKEAYQQHYECSRNQFHTIYRGKPHCVDCFCNDITDRCSRALYYTSEITLRDVTGVKAVTEGEKLPPNAIYYSSSNEVILGDLKDLGTPVVYWTLPAEFLGNQALAYGGILKYTVFYDVLKKSAPYFATDIKIKGENGQTIIHKKNKLVKRRIELTSEVPILESNFDVENGDKATRKDLMRILLNVQAIYIRATYAKDTKVTLLSGVSITSATPFFTRNGRTIFIEHCICPEGYRGLSCELCQRGYTQLITSSGEKKCVRCQCNRHSLECDSKTGICKNCQDNTEGNHCDQCKTGYFGNARRGTPEDCKRCACPLFVESNQFSPTCHETEIGSVECDACQEGYRGKDCGECAMGYDGNPRIPGGKCIKTLRTTDRMPRISVSPKRRTDPVGYRTTFTCTVYGSGDFYVTWSRKDARPLPVGRSRVISRRNSWILIISSLKVNDEGDYVCTARNRYGIASYSVDISIYKGPVPVIKVSVSPKSLRITEGSSALFMCSVNNVLVTHTRSWTRDGYRLLPSSAEVIDGTLSFRSARKVDSGVYSCSASNQVSVDSATVLLSVGALTKPQLSIWPLVQTVDAGKRVRFHCTSTGFPRPEIFWSRSDGDEDEGSYSMSGNGVLTIDRVRIKDEGEYICTGRNSGGEISRKAVLYVRSQNRRLSISVFPKKLQTYIGEKAVFRCASSGQNKPLLRWNVKNVLGVNADEGLLTFDSVARENTGYYVCTASNQYSTVSTKVKLIVMERPMDKLQAVMEPDALTIDEGQSATLRCNVNGTVSVITWSKDDGMLSDNHMVNKQELNITAATVKDEGTYFCIAKNKNTIARASSNVIVVRNVLPKINILPTKKLSTSIGDAVHFRCVITDGQPVEEMVWYKDNKVLASSVIKQANITAELLLKFENVQKSNEGEYYCAAVNKVGFAKEVAILAVSGKPSMILTPRGLYNATNGDHLLFECSATGFPVPNVQWFYSSMELRRFITLTSWPGYARIEMEAKAVVQGIYTCKASNTEGEVTDSISVYVKNNSLGPTISINTSVVYAVQGERVTIDCQPLGIPTPEFAWVRPRSNAPSLPLSKENVLEIVDVQLSDEGRYVCRAWNRYGAAQANVELKVSILPTVSVTPTSLVLLSGRSFSLECNAKGYPAPSIKWVTPNKTQEYASKNGRLEVHSSTGSHSGAYECISENKGGTVSKVVNVTILVQPEIVSSSKEEIIAKIGQNISLYCNATGFPQPSLSWYKDQSLLINEKQAELSLLKLGTESQGQYQCVASNLAGQAEQDFSIAIEEVPTANVLEDSGTGLKTVPVGDSVTLTCIATGNPEPLIRWTKTNGRLPAGVLVEGGILKIFKANVDDSGTFRCSAQNPVGIVHADVQIFVQGAPTVQVNPKSMEVQVGKEARISCSANGIPTPKIQWKKVGGRLPTHSIVNGQLIIPKAKRGDAGEYLCIATNSRGTAEDQSRLRTTDFLPRFSVDGESYIIYGTILGALYQTRIEITFRHENENGLLLYNGKPDGDFISIGIHEGYALFQYNLGSGPAYIRGHRRLALFSWHTLVAYRDGLDGTLTIDDDPVVYGKSRGKYTGLNLNGDLFIGGHPNIDVIKRQTSHGRGFTGCISQILIAGEKFNIGEDSLMMVEISDCNICLTQPCNNNGVCLASANRYGYKCECNPGFTGQSCNGRVARCFPGACGDGICTDTGNAAFKCKCPLGTYGTRCELGNSIKTPFFATHSYIAVDGIKGAWEDLHIFIKFKPKSSNGVILFNGGAKSFESSHDYICIQLVNGHIQLQFNSGSGPAVITHYGKVNIDSWNEVEIERFRQYGSISLNGQAAAKGESQGHSVALNLGPLMFIGGSNGSTSVRSNATSIISNGFDGCIQDVVINSEKIDLVGNFVVNKGIIDCDTKISPCVPSPCRNKGICQIVSAVTYKCICPIRYFGMHCETFRRGCGGVESCQNGGTCVRSIKQKLTCHCKLGFIGRACEKAIQIEKEVLFNGDGYLQFPRNVLSKIELSFLRFDIKTKADNGLIFWFGEEKDISERENPDFLAIGLKNGFLEISYELGSGLAVILTEKPVNDGSWHTIQINRSSKNASLFIDKKLVGHTQSSGINTHLDIEAPIFFGGGKDVEHLTRQKFKHSYFGCIGNVYIENREVFLQDMAEDGRNAHPCIEGSI